MVLMSILRDKLTNVSMIKGGKETRKWGELGQKKGAKTKQAAKASETGFLSE
jgi:hypothetical protein